MKWKRHKKKTEEWEKGQVIKAEGKEKLDVKDLGYKVEEVKATQKRKEEWEKGKQSRSSRNLWKNGGWL